MNVILTRSVLKNVLLNVLFTVPGVRKRSPTGSTFQLLWGSEVDERTDSSSPERRYARICLLLRLLVSHDFPDLNARHRMAKHCSTKVRSRVTAGNERG